MGYFLAKTQYNTLTEKNENKKVTRLSLMDGILYGEIEQRIFEELTPFASDKNVFIADIKRYTIQDLISNYGDTFFRIQIIYKILDEKSGKEAETKHYYLVSSDDMTDAQAQLKEYLKGSLGDWEFGKIETTKIVDVFV